MDMDMQTLSQRDTWTQNFKEHIENNKGMVRSIVSGPCLT